jgi:hypothetical protein
MVHSSDDTKMDLKNPICVIAFALTLVSGTSEALAATQIQFQDACSYSERVDLFGTGTVEFRIEKGAIFSQSGMQDGAASFCGSVTQHTPPFGWISTDHCVATNGGVLVAFPNSNKIVKSGCQVTDPNVIHTGYNEAEFAPWDGKGTAMIRGQAFLKTVGGDVKTCAGEDVFLLPATSYVDEFIATPNARGHLNVDPRLTAKFRSTICDAQGNFTFASVPAQRWYIDTRVVWGVPHIEQPGERAGPIASLLLGIPPPPQIDQQGGELLKAITLQEGDNQTFLTDRDRRD